MSDPQKIREFLSPEGIPLRFELASVSTRISAFIKDMLWMFGGIIAISLGIVLLSSMFGDGDDGLFTAVIVLLSFIVRTFYFSFFEIAWQGATPGKRSAGIRVIDAQGGPLRPQAVFARNVTRELETFIPLVVLLVPSQLYDLSGVSGLVAVAWILLFLLMPLLNRDNLRVGDFIAGTRVVIVPKPALLTDVGTLKREATYTFTSAQLSHYGNYELQVLEDILRGETNVDSDSLRIICEKICRRIEWVSRDSVSPMRFLEDFYNAQRSQLEKGLLFGRRHADKQSARAAREKDARNL